MRESEHKYRQVFECLGDAVFLADEATGKIIDTNHGAKPCWVAREQKSWATANPNSCHHWSRLERASPNPWKPS
jgi:hypothetical protein